MNNPLFNLLKSEVSGYSEALTRVGKLRLIALISRVLGRFLLILTLVLFAFALFAFGAVAAISALSVHMPVWAAALIIAGVCVLLIIITIACRRTLFINPFISILSDGETKTEQELEMKAIEADHKAEIERMRIETRVDNVTRTFNFYADVFQRIWSYFKK
jgi:membrane protein implicated in regulation of membrane protease activity